MVVVATDLLSFAPNCSWCLMKAIDQSCMIYGLGLESSYLKTVSHSCVRSMQAIGPWIAVFG